MHYLVPRTNTTHAFNARSPTIFSPSLHSISSLKEVTSLSKIFLANLASTTSILNNYMHHKYLATLSYKDHTIISSSPSHLSALSISQRKPKNNYFQAPRSPFFKPSRIDHTRKGGSNTILINLHLM